MKFTEACAVLSEPGKFIIRQEWIDKGKSQYLESLMVPMDKSYPMVDGPRAIGFQLVTMASYGSDDCDRNNTQVGMITQANYRCDLFSTGEQRYADITAEDWIEITREEISDWRYRMIAARIRSPYQPTGPQGGFNDLGLGSPKVALATLEKKGY